MDIQLIASLQKHSKKPSKADCYAMVKRLIEITPENENLAELNMLYQYFTPAIPAKPKQVTDWIMKALPKKDVRYYLLNAYCDKGRLVATDGHRLHIAHGLNLKEGQYYDKNMIELDNSDNHFGKYPDIDRVIPDIAKMRMGGRVDLSQIEQKHFEKNGKPENISVLIGSVGAGEKYHEVKICVQTPYLADAISYMDNPIWFHNPDMPEANSILIKDEGKDIEAVVMPFRM